jgi:putative transposase
LYVAGLKDLFSGELVGYAINVHLTKQLVMQALFRAVTLQRPPAGLTIPTVMPNTALTRISSS